MSRYIIRAVEWDEDGVVTIGYLDKDDALRYEGAVWRSQNVSLSPEGTRFYQDTKDIYEAVTDLLRDLTQLYRDEPPFIPGDEGEEDSDDMGMGY
jgi:hypothetical protein